MLSAAAPHLPDLARASGQAPFGILAKRGVPTSGKGNQVKSLVTTCAATSFAIPTDVAVAAAVVALALLIIAVVATALFSCSKTKRSATAVAVLRILFRMLISVCILLYWLHR
jgi:hypothetical protein